MKLSTAVEQYLNDCRIRGHATETLQAYKSDLTLLVSLASVRAADSVLAFTPELARAFFLMLSEKGLSMATLHRRKASVTGFAKWGARRRFWASDPTAELPTIRRPARLPRPFDAGEVARLMALELPQQERALRALLYYTGLRITPISRLRLEDLSFSPTLFSNGLEVPGSVRALSKGRKPSVKPMHQELWSTLRDWLLASSRLEPKGFVFANRLGGPWSRDRMLTVTHRWGRAAGVAKCLPHRFRHTFATTLLEQGADIRLVQLLLDHEDLNSTQIYTRVSDARLGRAVLGLPSFGVLSDTPVSEAKPPVEEPQKPAE
jgi:integrase/recombinase XerD